MYLTANDGTDSAGRRPGGVNSAAVAAAPLISSQYIVLPFGIFKMSILRQLFYVIEAFFFNLSIIIIIPNFFYVCTFGCRKKYNFPCGEIITAILWKSLYVYCVW